VSTYAQAAGQPAQRIAPRVVVLSPGAFADDWPGKPRVDVAIGLRLISEGDKETARTEATRQAMRFYEGRELECLDDVARDEAYNDGLMRYAVARATCNPNDLAQPYFEQAEDMVRIALTPEGVGRLWDELVILHKGSGVSLAPLEDERIGDLVAALKSGALRLLTPGSQAEVRKLLAYALDKLEPLKVVADALPASMTKG